jgi:hypothetical protein
VNSTPFRVSSSTVVSRSSHIKYSSWPLASAGCAASSRRRQLHDQPAPARVAEANSMTSRKNARTPSGSRVKMIACAPVTSD